MHQCRGESDFDYQCRALGYLSYLNSRMPARSTWPLLSLRVWLEPPILLRQFDVVFDRTLRPCGYYTWAWLPDEVSERLWSRQRDVPVLHISEWKEGDKLWIMDFVAVGSGQWSLSRQLVRRHLKEGQCIRYVKRDLAGEIARVVQVSRCDDRLRREAPLLP